MIHAGELCELRGRQMRMPHQEAPPSGLVRERFVEPGEGRGVGRFDRSTAATVPSRRQTGSLAVPGPEVLLTIDHSRTSRDRYARGEGPGGRRTSTSKRCQDCLAEACHLEVLVRLDDHTRRRRAGADQSVPCRLRVGGVVEHDPQERDTCNGRGADAGASADSPGEGEDVHAAERRGHGCNVGAEAAQIDRRGQPGLAVAFVRPYEHLLEVGGTGDSQQPSAERQAVAQRIERQSLLLLEPEQRAGVDAPDRVAMTKPSSGVSPIVVSMLRPPRMAAIDAPEPRWHETMRRPEPEPPATAGARRLTCAWERPWNPKRRTPRFRHVRRQGQSSLRRAE